MDLLVGDGAVVLENVVVGSTGSCDELLDGRLPSHVRSTCSVEGNVCRSIPESHSVGHRGCREA
jgi:hypothetical protein